ncbi:Alpha-D-kanosaminyltransferase [termite gut metagenome]|uniref:Alpha-D-kanosaminyltransferase n=1 Tax=termite gut metagenome TaxID=433724 RepID=A0A5J4QXG4_9ZZZZ
MENQALSIAFDAKRITHNRTGLGNYGRTLVNNLATYYPNNKYLLYTPDEGKKLLRKQIVSCQQIEFRYSDSNVRISKAWWRSFGIVKDLKQSPPSLYHGLSAELPFGLRKAGIKSVLTVHDLIFIRHPEYYNKIDRMIYTFKYKMACQQADHIIAISEMTKRDIISYFHVPEKKIDVIYQGCDESFKKEATQFDKIRVKKQYQLPDCYILYVGSMEERKNLMLIVKAIKQMKNPIYLVAVGKRTPYADKVEDYVRENSLKPYVSILNEVPFMDLPALYQQAALFIYPSRIEGFGIPIIEAIHSKVPVIATIGSCLEEAGGPNSLYVSPDNAMELAETIERIVTDKTLRKKMVEVGKEYVSQFESQILTQKLMNIYKKVLVE